ncbi:hypothetical protein TNCV_1729311 [Trichonephila clavipes]|nr:hypothetical protein TNCV_1729311 [Trichonephila clavipes]
MLLYVYYCDRYERREVDEHRRIRILLQIIIPAKNGRGTLLSFRDGNPFHAKVRLLFPKIHPCLTRDSNPLDNKQTTLLGGAAHRCTCRGEAQTGEIEEKRNIVVVWLRCRYGGSRCLSAVQHDASQMGKALFAIVLRSDTGTYAENIDMHYMNRRGNGNGRAAIRVHHEFEKFCGSMAYNRTEIDILKENHHRSSEKSGIFQAIVETAIRRHS